MRNKFNFETIIPWVASTLVACIALTSFAYSNFETKENSEKAQDALIKRLDRIEDKLDRLIEEK